MCRPIHSGPAFHHWANRCFIRKRDHSNNFSSLFSQHPQPHLETCLTWFYNEVDSLAQRTARYFPFSTNMCVHTFASSAVAGCAASWPTRRRRTALHVTLHDLPPQSVNSRLSSVCRTSPHSAKASDLSAPSDRSEHSP